MHTSFNIAIPKEYVKVVGQATRPKNFQYAKISKAGNYEMLQAKDRFASGHLKFAMQGREFHSKSMHGIDKGLPG